MIHFVDFVVLIIEPWRTETEIQISECIVRKNVASNWRRTSGVEVWLNLRFLTFFSFYLYRNREWRILSTWYPLPSVWTQSERNDPDHWIFVLISGIDTHHSPNLSCKLLTFPVLLTSFDGNRRCANRVLLAITPCYFLWR